MGLYVNKRLLAAFFCSNQPEYCFAPPPSYIVGKPKGGTDVFWIRMSPAQLVFCVCQVVVLHVTLFSERLTSPARTSLRPLYSLHLLVGEFNLSTSACSLACFAGDKNVISQTPCWLSFADYIHDWFLRLAYKWSGRIRNAWSNGDHEHILYCWCFRR
jgi:hypothetical protein